MGLITGPSVAKIARILGLVDSITQCIIQNEEHQDGCILAIADRVTGDPLVMHTFGTLIVVDYKECWDFALEKASRLGRNPLDHTSSQSRNMTTTPKRYGGAVRGMEFIFSISGFKEEQDEAAGLLTELKFSPWGNINNAPRWMGQQAKQNSYFSRLDSLTRGII